MLLPVLSDEPLIEIEGMLTTLSRLFVEAGFQPVQPPHLFPADTVLDLYGEEIRGRAFLFPDPFQGGELCLRPDFTVPVAQAHRKIGWDRPQGYTYQGSVFRRQEAGATRAVEHIQAGIEDFGAPEKAVTDARIFSVLHQGLQALSAPPMHIKIGDLGIVIGLLDALDIPDFRRQELRRHLWRRERFQKALDHFVGAPAAPSPGRTALIEAVHQNKVADLARQAGDFVGRRRLEDVVARAHRLADTATTPAMPVEQAQLIGTVLAVSGEPVNALARLTALAAEGGVNLSTALNQFERRLEALDRAGHTPAGMQFDTSFGRTLEYYDGFVFEITCEARPDGPPLAAGGRYDAITARLGATEPVPAVGGIIRPEAVSAAIRGHAS